LRKAESGVLDDESARIGGDEGKPAAGELLILATRFCVGALDLATLRKFNARLELASALVATPFGHRSNGFMRRRQLWRPRLQKILSQVQQGPINTSCCSIAAALPI